jgi:HlyD family secretion protein
MKIVKILIANKTLLLGGLFLLLLAGFGADFLSKADPKVGERKISLLQVGKKSFVLTIMERGIVSPARISPISSQISSNQAKIVWLVKEGTSVKKGTLVARFDTKPFMDSLLKAEQDFADANATFLASEKLLSLQREEESGKTEEAVRMV